jgi:hypothetical protein
VSPSCLVAFSSNLPIVSLAHNVEVDAGDLAPDLSSSLTTSLETGSKATGAVLHPLAINVLADSDFDRVELPIEATTWVEDQDDEAEDFFHVPPPGRVSSGGRVSVAGVSSAFLLQSSEPNIGVMLVN